MSNTKVSFSQFSQSIEGQPHSSVHINIGGQSGGDMVTPHSVNDILFWLHHAHVDKIYQTYQTTPGNTLDKFDSAAYVATNQYSGPATGNTVVPSFNVPVSVTFDISKLCYSYQDPSSYAFSISMDYNATTIVNPDPLSPQWIKNMGANATATAAQQAAIAAATAATNNATAANNNTISQPTLGNITNNNNATTGINAKSNSITSALKSIGLVFAVSALIVVV